MSDLSGCSEAIPLREIPNPYLHSVYVLFLGRELPEALWIRKDSNERRDSKDPEGVRHLAKKMRRRRRSLTYRIMYKY